MYTPRNAGVSTPPSRPERPQGYSHPGLGVSPLREKRRLSTGSSFDSSVSFASDRSNPNVNPNHRGSTGGSRVSTERPPAATEEKRRETVKNVLNDMGVSRNKVESDTPPGASREKNQYLLLSAPMNQRFLSALSLNDDVFKKLPSRRKEIIELFKAIDKANTGWITTQSLEQHLRSLGLSITPSEVYRLVKMCDLNEDNYIQPIDMVNAFQKLQPMQSVGMCMPSHLGRAKHIADMILLSDGVGQKTLHRNIAGFTPENPGDVLNDIFDFNSPIQKSSVQQPIKPKPYGESLIVPNKHSDQYADSTERMETMNQVMDWNNPFGTKPPGIEETHKRAHQRNRRLDRIKNYVDDQTVACRERDAKRDNYEEGRINTKIKQRARYTKAALFGADLYDRVEEKKKNRMEKMGRSPIHKQTFAISPRGTVQPVYFYPGTNQFVELEDGCSTPRG